MTAAEHDRVLKIAKAAGLQFIDPPRLETIAKLIKLTYSEALEDAAVICDDLHHKWRWDDNPDSTSGPRDCSKAIRAKKG